MQIKKANDTKNSSTIKAAKRSNMTVYAMFLCLGIAGVVWEFSPQSTRNTVSKAGAAALVPIGFVLTKFNSSVVNGRLKIGDLDELVDNLGLFTEKESLVVESLESVIKGKATVLDLPQVRGEIERQVKAAIGEKSAPVDPNKVTPDDLFEFAKGNPVNGLQISTPLEVAKDYANVHNIRYGTAPDSESQASLPGFTSRVPMPEKIAKIDLNEWAAIAQE
jgi:hypothetical protein